jgi:predicted nucleic acid-binding protein
LELVPSRAFRLVASPALYLEYEAVLTRPEHLNVHGLSPRKIEEALVYLAGFTDKVRIHFSYRPQLRDANDEMVLEAALNGQADAIVTHNIRDFSPVASRFGIEVLTPGRILEERLQS